MEAINYTIKPLCSGRVFKFDYNTANIRLAYQKHIQISVKITHNTLTVDLGVLCKDKSHTKSDEIKIQKEYKIANFL